MGIGGHSNTCCPKTWPPSHLQILALFISHTQNSSLGKAPLISKSHDSSTHPLPRTSRIRLRLKLQPSLSPSTHASPGSACPRPLWPATSALPTDSSNNTLLPGLLKTPSALARPGLQILPPKCPKLSSAALATNRALGVGAPSPNGLPDLRAGRRPPRSRTQPATSPRRLCQQGPCPRPPASRRPSPPPALPPPRTPRCLPAGGQGAPGAPALRSGCPGPAVTSAPPAPALLCGRAAARPPPAPRRARSGLAPRAWRVALERHDHRPRSPGRAPAPRRAPDRGRKGWGRRERPGGQERRAGSLGRRGGGAHRAPRARAPLRRHRPCPRPYRQGRGLAGGPGARPGPSAGGGVPVGTLAAGPRKPGRHCGLQQSRPRRARQASPRRPPAVPYPSLPAILAAL